MSDHEDAQAEPPDGNEGEGAAEEESREESAPDDETADQPDPEALIEAVEEHDESLAADVEGLLERVEGLETEVETLESDLETAEERLERTRADFRNYKERAKRRREEEKERATEDLVERLLEVRDNLGRALDEESGSVESLREGVELTRKQFDRVLEEENVERIEPSTGTEVDPNRHEVMMRVESDEPGGTVASVYRPGYEMAEKVLRPAQVTVAEDDDEQNADSKMDSEADEGRQGTDDAKDEESDGSGAADAKEA